MDDGSEDAVCGVYDEVRLHQAFLTYGIKRLEDFNNGEGEALDGKTLEVLGRLLEKADVSRLSKQGHDPLTVKQGQERAAALLKEYGPKPSA